MNLIERKIYQRLIDQGYLVERPIRTRWHKTDLFGIWDFIAIKNTHIRFIQVSRKYFTQKSKRDQDQMLNFPRPPYSTKEYWHWPKRKKSPRIILIDEKLRTHLINLRLAKLQCQKKEKQLKN